MSLKRSGRAIILEGQFKSFLISNAIQDWVERVAKIPVDDANETPDVCIIELDVRSSGLSPDMACSPHFH
jgi:hypothetical protein